ncbi:hypothetical protein DAEQUDRAFT_557647 [Daedalea quercina L-15889]|uniref:Uncharacterized protein n=1 Tax=Daedalea quercina L-15889 TaxID=1314783 RepID=A0A165M231_9APHY|nr:hypothetical protein DAEQUDRAFT_557647 [Daedalea quercina L-15889]
MHVTHLTPRNVRVAGSMLCTIRPQALAARDGAPLYATLGVPGRRTLAGPQARTAASEAPIPPPRSSDTLTWPRRGKPPPSVRSHRSGTIVDRCRIQRPPPGPAPPWFSRLSHTRVNPPAERREGRGRGASCLPSMS